MSNTKRNQNVKKCDRRDIDHSQNEMAFKLTDVTHLLPEAHCPILVSERLDSELNASDDYRGQVWDLFFMGARSPKRVRQTYNVYFSLVLNGREQTACVTQCGGSYTEDYFVFALAGENIYYEVDVRNPAVRALVEANSEEVPLPSRPVEDGSICLAKDQENEGAFDENDRDSEERFNEEFETVLRSMIGGRGSKYYEPGQLIVEGSKQPIKDLVLKVAMLLGEFHGTSMRDPRGHDMKQLHNVLLGYVLSSRHMWEVLTEGSRNNLTDILERLPTLLDVLDQQHEDHCKAYEEGDHEFKLEAISSLSAEEHAP